MLKGFLRWIVNSVSTLILADRFLLNEALVPGASRWLAYVAAAALLLLVVTSDAFKKWVPHYEFRRQGTGSFGFAWVAAEIPGTKRLAAETHAYVADVYAYLAQAANARASEEDATQTRRDSIDALMRKSAQEQRELKQRFGGRLEYLLAEYERRGMIDLEERVSMEWQLGSSHWSPDMASRLEGLALRLQSGLGNQEPQTGKGE